MKIYYSWNVKEKMWIWEIRNNVHIIFSISFIDKTKNF